LLGSFIPAYRDKKVAVLDLDQEARDCMSLAEYHGAHPTSFSDAEFCSKFVEDLHQRRGIDASFGGYLEDRSFLWQGTYLKGSERALHLGIDFNVPAGNEVATPFGGRVVRIDDDSPERHGWGPRIFLECAESGPMKDPVRYVYIFAHLTDIKVSEGDNVDQNQVLARIGAPPRNGDWFPHLHLQKVRGDVFERYRTSDLWKLDGYGLRSEVEALEVEFPNPLSYAASVIMGLL
jgi:murein DD-endopeptidase MepM/ murein hydrolase activator NlpD